MEDSNYEGEVDHEPYNNKSRMFKLILSQMACMTSHESHLQNIKKIKKWHYLRTSRLFSVNVNYKDKDKI